MGQVKQQLLDMNTGFAVGYHGSHERAVEYMLDAMEADPANQVEFLRAWREGNLEEWPDYYDWLHQVEDDFRG